MSSKDWDIFQKYCSIRCIFISVHGKAAQCEQLNQRYSFQGPLRLSQAKRRAERAPCGLRTLFHHGPLIRCTSWHCPMRRPTCWGTEPSESLAKNRGKNKHQVLEPIHKDLNQCKQQVQNQDKAVNSAVKLFSKIQTACRSCKWWQS